MWSPNEWCDVGTYVSVGPESHGTDSPQKAIKGWYDEQYLADPSPGGPVRTDVIGTVFPVAGLSRRTKADYDTGFVTVAYVALRTKPTIPTAADSQAARASLAKYTARFGFHAVDPDQPFDSMSTISLCSGPKEVCFRGGGSIPTQCTPQSFDPDGNLLPEQWWARTKGKRSKPIYFCVTYRQHPENFKMPGVVRWRWHPNPGETNWMECPKGCCENES
jgi:hypothetical protein